MVSVSVIFGGVLFFLFSFVCYIMGAFLTKQLFVMRKFGVALSFLYYLETFWKKSTVASFQLTTRNLNVLLCTLPILCTPVRVQRCFTNFHLVDK